MLLFKLFIIGSLVCVFLTFFFMVIGVCYDFNPPKWIEKTIDYLSIFTLFLCLVWLLIIFVGLSISVLTA